MQYLSLVFIVFLLASCAQKEVPVVATEEVVEEYIEELHSIPQDISYYTKNLQSIELSTQEAFEKEYFRPWNIQKCSITVDDAMWAHKSYNAQNSYGDNLQPLSDTFFEKVLQNANYKEYTTVNKKAVTTRRLDIRAMPWDKPVFLDPKRAGEGFPFDYLQNSSIGANKPVIISHYSKDKKWVFIESSFTYGWVESSDVVIIDEKYTKLWQQAEQVFLIKDGVPIYSEDGRFLFYSQIGMMLPLIDENETEYTVLTVKSYKDSKAFYLKSKIAKEAAQKGILEFSSANIDKIIKEISKSNYGWGGLYGQRDCSSTLRDFYAPFGLWLPRNSYQQSVAGEVIDVASLNNEEKEKSIKTKAIPFRTLIYKRGHIGLYVGIYNNRAIIYQNVWGVKTKKENVEGR